MIEVKKIRIKNFKNLKDVEINPRKFNVLVGPNGSGKTNFIEFFKLLRKIYVERNPYPFLEWDGYENVVWNHDKCLPIEFEIETVEKATLTELFSKYILIDDLKVSKNIELEIHRGFSLSIIATQSEKVRFLEEVFTDEVILNLNDKKLEGKAEIDSLSLELSKIVEEFIFYNLDAIDAFNHLMDCELNLDFVKVLSSELEKKVSEKTFEIGS